MEPMMEVNRRHGQPGVARVNSWRRAVRLIPLRSILFQFLFIKFMCDQTLWHPGRSAACSIRKPSRSHSRPLTFHNGKSRCLKSLPDGGRGGEHGGTHVQKHKYFDAAKPRRDSFRGRITRGVLSK